MDRETAVKIWRDVAFGSPDSLITGRMIEAFANRVAEIERKELLTRITDRSVAGAVLIEDVIAIINDGRSNAKVSGGGAFPPSA